MQKSTETFDSLVAGLSLDERVSMLHQMKGQIKPEIEYLEKDTRKDTITIQALENLKKESIFLRIIIALKSIFTNKTREVLYSEHQLGNLVKRTAHKYPEYFNAQELCLEKSFYDALEELKAISKFFIPSITQADAKSGEFLVLLGSLILSDLEKRIEDEANPYNHPFTQDVSNSLRVSLLRTMEGILADVSSVDKNHLYTCVKSLTWLRDFCQLPFEDFQRKFITHPNGKLRCGVRSCGSDIEKFSNILCYSKNIEPEIIEALYLFSIQSRLDNGESFDVDTETDNYMKSSLYSLRNLTSIINSIPLRALHKIAKHSLKSEPIYSEKTEDWYIAYKEQWKKLFDAKWSAWQHDRNISVTKKRTIALCKTKDFPTIPNKPWEKLQINFQKELTLGFLYSFFTDLYTNYGEVLKVLIMHGEFVIPENKAELMDTFSDLNSLAQRIRAFNDKLSAEGTYGMSLLKIKHDSLYTVQGKSHLQSLLLTLVAEVDLLVLNFTNLMKVLQKILDGILISNYNVSYDGIANIATLLAPDKTPIRRHLVEIKDALLESEIILNDLASIELRGTKNESQ